MFLQVTPHTQPGLALGAEASKRILAKVLAYRIFYRSVGYRNRVRTEPFTEEIGMVFCRANTPGLPHTALIYSYILSYPTAQALGTFSTSSLSPGTAFHRRECPSSVMATVNFRCLHEGQHCTHRGQIRSSTFHPDPDISIEAD